MSSKSGLTMLEQETIVNYNLGEKLAEVYTADPNVIRKLDKLVAKYPDAYKVIREDDVSKTYQFSKKLVSFRNPPKVYTEEEKEIARQQFAKNLMKSKNKQMQFLKGTEETEEDA